MNDDQPGREALDYKALDRFKLANPKDLTIGSEGRFAVMYPDCEFSVYHGPYHDQGICTLLIWHWDKDDQVTVPKVFSSLMKAQRLCSRLNDDKARLHSPTSSLCSVIRTKGDRSLCEFYDRPNRHVWVNSNEIR